MGMSSRANKIRHKKVISAVAIEYQLPACWWLVPSKIRILLIQTLKLIMQIRPFLESLYLTEHFPSGPKPSKIISSFLISDYREWWELERLIYIFHIKLDVLKLYLFLLKLDLRPRVDHSDCYWWWENDKAEWSLVIISDMKSTGGSWLRPMLSDNL